MSSQKRLYRTDKDKILGGVSSGLGDYFNIDPVIFRILFLVLLFVEGIGAIAYIILWIIVPFRSEGDTIREVESS